jgi:3',5'-cyclic AMP phosphodiesterase CpdA
MYNAPAAAMFQRRARQHSVAPQDRIIYLAVLDSRRNSPGSVRLVSGDLYGGGRGFSMKRIIWLTDIHLNHLSLSQATAFAESLQLPAADACIVAGDIGESHSIIEYLLLLDRCLQRPLYFVLGNHDYYRGAVAGVRSEIRAFAKQHQQITWLGDGDIIALTPSVGLIGVESWADGGYGDYDNSPILLADYFMIRELMSIFPDDRPPREDARLHIYSPEHEEWLYSEDARQKRRHVIERLGREGADGAREKLPDALKRFEQVILVSHVPPFAEACMMQGRRLNGDWLPHYACKAVGDAIREIMKEHPGKRLTVLCGHTHSGARVRVSDNIEVITGAATYGSPAIQEPIEIF